MGRHKKEISPSEMKKRGRPTKYRPEFCQMLIEFFDVEPWEEREIPHYERGELKWTDIKRFPARMPTLQKFAKIIQVDVSNVYEWVKESSTAFQPAFHKAFTLAKEIRKEWLIDLGLSGLTPPLSYKFTAINVTDMVDKTGVEISPNDKLKEFMDWLAGRNSDVATDQS